MVRTHPRRAFTFIGLIIIIAILLFLIGFLVPLVGRVRQAATQAQSQNNLKQLALAVHNAHDTYGKFPPTVGQMGNGTGTVHYHLLPFLEQDNLYKIAEGAVWKKGVNGIPVAVYLDNLDTTAPEGNKFKNWLATTNYVANWLCFKNGENTLAGIPDGTSNTLMFAQRYQMCNGHPTAWGYPALYYWAPMFGYYSQAKFQVAPKQEDCDPGLAQALNTSGMQVAMCDGSVRMLNINISGFTWGLLTDPQDGNILPNDF
ncbi:MAG: DUF1559 domain-containing protein [Acidobacteriales bacterium]|nr:DUF1559 domain-containing protein [Terriglobales bacterium]